MAYGGENEITILGWSGARGKSDEPDLAKINRILVQRFQITASEQMAPADTTVLTANTQKLTIPAGTFKAGDRLIVRGWGKVTAANSTDAIAGFVKLGGASGVTLATTASADATLNDYHEFVSELWWEAVGAAAASKFHSHGRSFRTGGSDARTYVIDDTSRDTTAALDIVFAQQWTVNNAGNRFKLYELSAELYRTRQAWG